MASSGKKTKKKKKTTISIAGTPLFSGGSAVHSTESWADQSEIELIESIRNVSTDINLPKAPRSTRECEFDDSNVPTSPPFQAHLTNIPFDITEDEIVDCFSKFNIVSCILPKDSRHGSNRLKGYGYIEFDLRSELIEALCIGEMNVKGRRMKIDLPGRDRDRPGFGDRDRGREGFGNRQGNRMGDGDPDDPDRTTNDWRSAPRPAMPEREGFERRGDRREGRDRDDRGFKRSGFGDRDRDRDGPPKEIDDDSCWRDGNREAPPARERESTDRNGWRERDRSAGTGFERRERNGFDRIRERDRDKDPEKERERDGSLDWRVDKGPQESRAFDRRDRDSGFGRRDRDRDGDRGFERRGRDGFRDRDRDGDRDRDRDRDSGFGRRDRDRNDGFERRDRDRDGFDRKGDPERSERGWRDEPRVVPAPPPEKPAREAREASVSPEREKKEEPATPATRRPLNLKPRTTPISNTSSESTSSSVFGSAKPVDTAAKERELEEKWRTRDKPEPSGGEKAERSEKGEKGERGDRERKGRRDKDKDHHKDKDSETRPAKENEPPKEDGKVFEPAPPPKENVWTKRRSQQMSNNGLIESEDSKAVKKTDSESKERSEEVIHSNESKPKAAPVESAPKETSKPKLKETSSNDAKTNSNSHQVNDSKKSDDRTINNRVPPKATEKPVKPQPQEPQEPQDPSGEDSEWSTKTSRIETEDIQSKIPKAKEQKPPNFAGINKYALFEDPEDVNKAN